ncbi:MAG: hypothetical protein ABI988_05405 [Nitrospirota bacterium]
MRVYPPLKTLQEILLIGRWKPFPVKGVIRAMRDVVLHAWVGAAGRLTIQLSAVR